jgi:hypothetical protein
MAHFEQTAARWTHPGGWRQAGRRSFLAAVALAGALLSGASPAGADTTSPPSDGADPASTSTSATSTPASQADTQSETQPQPAPTPEGSTAGNTADSPSAESAGSPSGPSAPPPAARPEDRPTLGYLRDPRSPRERAAAYAYRWALSTNRQFAFAVNGHITVPTNHRRQPGRAVDPRNSQELDCTSFVSQALHAGGFEYTKKWNFDTRKRTATIAWVRAGGRDSLAPLFMKTGRMRLLNPGGAGPGQAPPSGIQIGDVIGWDPYVRPHQMQIDHQLVVTEVIGDGHSWADIHVSYHTYDHRNRAMDEYAEYYRDEISSAARLYAFHVRYPGHRLLTPRQ